MNEAFFVYPGEKELARKHFRKAQRGGCAICSSSHNLVVDHEHSGLSLVRGLLCMPCNIALGHFRDDPGRLANAIEYLAVHAERNDAYRQSDELITRLVGMVDHFDENGDPVAVASRPGWMPPYEEVG